jgi:plastocyanin
MKYKSRSVVRLKALVILLSLGWISVHQAGAAEHVVEGQIKVYKKGGERSFWWHHNAVVYLEGVEQQAPAVPAEIDQRNKKFSPRVLPVVKGQVVRFHNQDRVDHNVFSTEVKNTFDLGRYPKGEYRDQVYDELGTYKVYCNIHKKMILDVVVLPNSYFATTDKKGNYRIEGVPAGEYVLKAWHIYGGTSELPVSVKRDTVIPELSLASTRVVRDVEDHLNKFGEKYKKKSHDFYK